MSPLVERDDALGVLRSAWTEARWGNGGFVALTGPSGVGRTALLAEVADEAASTASASLVRVDLAPADGASGAAVARRLVLGLAAREPGWIEHGAARWARPLIEPSIGEVDPAAVTAGVLAVLDLAADAGPVAVVIDDLHHADAASLRVLADVASAARRSAVLVVATWPTPDGGPGAAARADLARRGRQVEVTPLTERGVVAWATTILVDDVDEAFAAEACRLAEGRPALLAPLLQAAHEAGLRGGALDAPRLGALALPTLPAQIETRLGPLEPAARRVIEAAAVLPGPLRSDVVLAAAEVDPAAAAGSIAALVDAGLLAAGPGIRWRSPLLASATRRLVGEGTAGAIATRAASAHHDAGDPPETAAALLLDAPPVGAPWAAAVLAGAALEAERCGAPEAAKALWLRQLDEPMDPIGRGWATASVARAELRLGDPAGLERLEALVPAIDDPGLRARARFAAGRAALWEGQPERAKRSFQAAALDAAGLDDEVAQRSRAGELLALGIGLAPVRRLEQAIDAVPALGESAGASSIRGALALARVLVGQWGQGEAAARDALADRRLHEPATSDNTAVAAASTALAAVGFPGDALEPLDRVLHRARREGQLATLGTIEATRAAVLLAAGRLPEAAEAAQAALGAVHANPIERATAAAVLADVLCLGGEGIAAAEALDRGRPPARTRSGPALLGELRWHAAAARLALARQQPVAALAEVEVARHVDVDLGVVRLDEAEIVALAASGRRDEAVVGARDLVSRRSESDGPAQARARSIAAWLDDDPEAAAAAAASLEHHEDPIGAIEALLRSGEVLERAGRRSDARQPFRRALDLADRRRAEALAVLAVEGLRRVGGRVRRRALVGVEALTPAEIRVCRLVAAGRTNREVADALFLSRKTVEYHLGNAYGKLAIERREQLPGALGAEVTEGAEGSAAG